MRGRAFILVAVAAVVVAAVAVGGTAIAGSRDGGAPSAAATVAAAVSLARAALPATARDVHGGHGGELLSVDLRGDGSADVVLYDYAANRTHDITVRDGEVVSDRAAARAQPPASGDEIAAAFAIALHASPELPFRATYAAQQGVPLVSADQVQVEATIWTAADPTTPGTGAAGRGSVCGLHRCVQLVVATAAGEYLDTTDFVVDLSAGRVLRLRGAS